MMTDPLNYAGPQTPVSPRRFGRGIWGWVLWVGLAVLLFVWLKQNNQNLVSLPFSTFYAQVQAKNLSILTIDGDEVVGSFRTPISVGGTSVARFKSVLPPGLNSNWLFVQWLTENSGAEVRVEPTNNLLVNFVLPFIPWLLILAFIWFFVFRQLRAARQPMRVMVVNPE